MAAAIRAGLATRADRYHARMAALRESDDGQVTWTQDYQAVINAQREELLRWRDAGRLPDSSLRILRRELDHEERTLLDR